MAIERDTVLTLPELSRVCRSPNHTADRETELEETEWGAFPGSTSGFLRMVMSSL
jgi:hypothetical protein